MSVIDPLDLIEQRLNEKGCRPRRTGERIEARCPAHDDSSPSLSVARGATRDIVVHCHAGCPPDAVMHAIDVAWTDLSDRHKPDDTFSATYEYCDAQGRPIYRVVRAPGKKFWQQHLTPNGEWVAGLNGVPRVLYRLPEVLRAVANGETVYVCEGEKDVDRVRVEGVAATCNSGGAGKFTDSHADVLAGATVVIIADRDKPGMEHAEQVRALLLQRGCSVRVAMAATGKDAFDHLAAGRTLDQLLDVDPATDEAVEVPEPDDLDTYAHIVDWEQFWANDTEQEEWLAFPLIPKGRSIALFAPAKAGKSTIVLSVVAALATGGDILGFGTCDPAKVLYLDYEMTPSDLMERLTDLGYGPHTDLSNLYYALLPTLAPLDTIMGSSAVVRLAERYGVDLVVVDTFGRAVEGEEDRADTVRAFYRHTGLALKARGIAVLRTDHAGKDVERGQRGTSAKADDVDIVFALKRTDTGVHIKRTHSRISFGPSEIVIDRDERDGVVTYASRTGEQFPAGTQEVIDLLVSLGIDQTESMRRAQQALRDAGHKYRNELIRSAQKARRKWANTDKQAVERQQKQAEKRARHTPGTATGHASGAPSGTSSETLENAGGTWRGTAGHARPSHSGTVPPSIEGHVPGPLPAAVHTPDTDDLF